MCVQPLVCRNTEALPKGAEGVTPAYTLRVLAPGLQETRLTLGLLCCGCLCGSAKACRELLSRMAVMHFGAEPSVR